MSKYLFFVRAYNDIDNIAPAIHFLLLSHSDARADIVIYSSDYDYRADLNLRFLHAQHGSRLEVHWLPARLGVSERILDDNPASRLYRKAVAHLPNKNVSRFGSGHPRFNPRLRDSIVDAMVGDGERPLLAVFDHNREFAVGEFVRSLRRHNFPIVSLPVSPVVTVNTMKRTLYTVRGFDLIEYHHSYHIFDKIAFTDDLYLSCLRRHYASAGRSLPFEDKIRILGSIRYCGEWLDIRKTFVPTKRDGGGDKPKIVVFLSQPSSNVHWDEVVRSLRMLEQYPEFDVVVKPHTRNMRLFGRSKATGLMVADDIASSSLIDWADIVLFWGTSVAIEGYIKGKTMINLDYVHPNRTSYEILNAGWILRSRDDLKLALDALVDDRSYKPYDEAQVRAFIDRLVYSDEATPVPKRYLEFLVEKQ